MSRYLGKLSGPLLDRFDLIVEMSSLSRDELLAPASSSENWLASKRAIADCQARQLGERGKLNGQLANAALEVCAVLGKEEKQLLADAMDRFSLSARTVHRVMRVARTIADLRGSAGISRNDLLEAVAFRRSPLIASLAA